MTSFISLLSNQPIVYHSKFVIKTALPFISLYKPVKGHINRATETYIVTRSIINLSNDHASQNIFATLRLVANFVQPFFGNIFTPEISNEMIELLESGWEFYKNEDHNFFKHLIDVLSSAVKVVKTFLSECLLKFLLEIVDRFIDVIKKGWLFYQKNDRNHLEHFIDLCLATIGFVHLFFNYGLLKLLLNFSYQFLKVLKSGRLFYQNENHNRSQNLVQLVSALESLVFVGQKNPYPMAISLASQSFLNIVQSYEISQTAKHKNEFFYEKPVTVIAKMTMYIITLFQLTQYLDMTHRKAPLELKPYLDHGKN